MLAAPENPFAHGPRDGIDFVNNDTKSIPAAEFAQGLSGAAALDSWGQDEGRAALRVHFLREVTSTNDLVKQAIDSGEDEGYSVAALMQTAGYGRQGRTWQSPIGGLYQSFLMRPQVSAAQLPTLSLVMGMAVSDAVCGLLPKDVQSQVKVKWPNDVVLVSDGADSADAEGTDDDADSAVHAGQFKKLAGISLERYHDAVCVGIGVNVSRPAESEALADTKNKAVYLDALDFVTGSVESRVERVSEVLTQQVWSLYDQWQSEGFTPFAQPFNTQYNALAGRSISMVDINDKLLSAGKVLHVDEFGRLVLRDAQGTDVPVCSGEAHIL